MNTQELLRQAQATNPDDHRQVSHRFGAVWGKPRITQRNNTYAKHYADLLDDHDEISDQPTGIHPTKQLVLNAKQWAYKKYPYLDQDDVSQEIDIKAWQLEEHEMDEEGNWVRPGYVMTALMNAATDMNRKETAVSSIVSKVSKIRHFETYDDQYDIVFTNKTLKAGLLLFMLQPTRLKLTTKDRMYMVYRNLSSGEHRQLLQECISPTPTSTRIVDRIVSKYIDIV